MQSAFLLGLVAGVVGSLMFFVWLVFHTIRGGERG